MKRISILLIIMSFFFNSCLKNAKRTVLELKPNIVILFVDDLGYYDVGFRNSNYHTPNIDKLASEGVVLENGYVPSPTCSPSRVGLYTGQHPARLQFYRHIPDNIEGEYHLLKNDSSLLFSRNYLPLETITYAEVVKKNGYNTFFVGKWHIGDDQYGPLKQGWDEAISKTSAGAPKSYYSPYFRGEGFWNDIQGNQYLTDFYTDRVVDYINNYNNSEPFLLQFSYHNVHTPSIGRKDFIQMYRNKGFEDKLIEYGAQVSAVDVSVGRILDALERTGKAKNTIVIFASDQGSFFPNLPLRGTKAAGTTLYEGGQKIPFIVKWPEKIKSGISIKTHIQTTDIFPTICEIVGDDPDNYKGIEGLSLLEVLTKGKPLDREAIFAFRSYDSQYASVLTLDNWKLIAYRDNRYELFLVDEDISEEHDLSKQHPEKVEHLVTLLNNWMKQVGVHFDENL